MKNPKKLNRRHKKYLSVRGYDPNDFFIVKEHLENYIFFNKVTSKLESMSKNTKAIKDPRQSSLR